MNYPGGINKRSNIKYGNRGMILEDDINATNNYYITHDIAVIRKLPTPITIKKVDYISSHEVKIKDAWFQKKSTTDYNGIYKGHYIDFEAKETRSKNYFPLSNIHQHQIEHIERIINHGGIAFLIVSFIYYNEIFLLDGPDFIHYIKNNKRKSIPYTYFQKKGYKIKLKYNPRLDYLKIIDKIYFKGELYEKEF